MILATLVFNTASACAVETRSPASGSEQSNSKTPAPIGEDKLETKVSGEIKELAAGSYSSIREPFIIVARDAQTYALLKELNGKLPEFGADFFESHAVIAAFLGQRRSGGYSVSITREGAGRGGGGGLLRIAEGSPPKDAMVTMALTAPFQIVSVAVEEESPLTLELGATWQAAARPYKVEAGEFTRTGGFVGRPEKSTLKGDIRIMRHAQLATLFFSLQGTGAEQGAHALRGTGADEVGARALQDVATGKVEGDGNFTLTRLDPGSFVPPPRHPLRAQGKFGDGENKLTFTFEILQMKVDDGYGGQGTLNATATAPPPQKRAIDDDDPM